MATPKQAASKQAASKRATPKPAGQAATRQAGVPRWLPLTAMVLALVGLAVSGYLTYEHFTESTTLACPATKTLDCAKVTSSEQSKLFGVPVALLGLAYFVGMLALVVPASWRRRDRRLDALRMLGGVGGVGFVFYLVYAELFIIDKICLWCTVVHVVAVALFAVIAFGAALSEPPPATTGPAGRR